MKKLLLSSATALTLVAGAASAAIVDLSFSGEPVFNEGAPGFGPFSGTIQIDTSAANFVGPTLYEDAVTSINMTLNGVSVQSSGVPNDNNFNQTNLPGSGADAFVIDYDGGFAPTGGALEILSVFVDVRFKPTVNVFDTNPGLFGALSDGDMLDINDIDFIRIAVDYVGLPSSQTTTLVGSGFGSFNVSVTDSVTSPVPLPAGLPLLLAGLGAFGLVRRWKT